jgi:hypothetical protein
MGNELEDHGEGTVREIAGNVSLGAGLVEIQGRKRAANHAPRAGRVKRRMWMPSSSVEE